MQLFFDDEEFEAQFARTVGKAAVGMADIGESFATAGRITAGDYGSWRDCWHATAQRIEDIADEAAEAGRRRSAGEAYLRASEYHRAGYFFTAQPGDAETRRLYDPISSPKVLAEFDPDAGEWGNCEGVALSRYDQVVHDWLDGILAS